MGVSDNPYDSMDDNPEYESLLPNSEDGMLEHDPDNPDPGCMHPWHLLSFLEGGLGLACEACLRTWILEDEPEELADALLSVWQSAKTEFALLESRHNATVELLEDMTDKRCCRVCGRWQSTGSVVRAGYLTTCPEHLGAGLSRVDDQDDIPFEEAVTRLQARLDDGTLESIWTVERNIAAYPRLAEALGRTMAVVRDQRIQIETPRATLLGLPNDTTVGQVADALAAALELDNPRTRAGITYLLAMLVETDQSVKLVEPGQTSFPVNPTDRALIVLDLCRSDLPEVIEFSGDMADVIVRSIAERASDLLAPDATNAGATE